MADIERVPLNGTGVFLEIWLEQLSPHDESVFVHVRDEQTQELVGSVDFKRSDPEFDGSLYWYCPGGSLLNDEYARRGIGTQMYVRAALHLRVHGREGRIRPSRLLTHLGLVFWDSLKRHQETFEFPPDHPWTSIPNGLTVEQAKVALGQP